MNYKSVFNILGRILIVEAGLMAVSAAVSLIYRESILSFLFAILIAAAAGAVLCVLPGKREQIYAREGFVIVALSWVTMSAVGALPFFLSGHIPSFIDAFFETVSGFTTTGSTILTNVEVMPYGLLFWRSFTHWVGGMGVLVFVLAIIPMIGTRSVHLMRAEVPGPTKGKLVPKMKSTAMILYGIYVILTAAEVIFLVAGGMPLFDALVHSFGSAGTGGFSIKNKSIEYYGSAYIETVIGVFVILFGINFNIYFLLLIKEFKSIFKNEELRLYLCIIAVSVIIITFDIMKIFGTVGSSLRYAFFQVASIITTTGYSSINFDLWPSLSRYILVLLMFAGACAGSTGGGLKTSRLIILFKSIRREIRKLLHPRSVNIIEMDDKVVDESIVGGTTVYFVAYMLVLLLSVFFVSFDGYDLETTTTAVISCISNIGPGLNLVGPAGNFSIFTPGSKVLLSLVMLIGRLEIYPVLMLFLPATWRRKM